MNTTPGPISEHPESVRLCELAASLREEVVRLLTGHDLLLHTVRPNLLALYQVRLAPWEMRLLKEQCATARLRRMIEMVQAGLNSGCLPEMCEVEKCLDDEFELWQVRIREAASRLEDAGQLLAHSMSPADDQEFKKLYRHLVKTLHPDVAPVQTEEMRLLWPRVQAAHERHDLCELRALSELVGRLAVPPAAPGSFAALQDQCEALRRQIERLARRIGELETQPPLSMRDNLNDADWLEQRRAEIEQRIATVKEQHAALLAHLRTLPLGNIVYGNGFSQN